MATIAEWAGLWRGLRDGSGRRDGDRGLSDDQARKIMGKWFRFKEIFGLEGDPNKMTEQQRDARQNYGMMMVLFGEEIKKFDGEETAPK